MSVPVIISTQSVLGCLEGENFSFLPLATNAPTGWTSTTLPTGVTLNAGTGLISVNGATALPGFYLVALTATNALGSSEPRVFSLSIQISAASAAAAAAVASGLEINSSAVTLRVNLDTHEVRAETVCLKSGDIALFNVVFERAGVVADLTLTGITIALKEFAPDLLIASSTVWEKSGTGIRTRYRVILPLTADEVVATLSQYAADTDTAFNARGEIEWIETLADPVGTGGGAVSSIRTTSRTFGVLLAQELKPN